MRKKIFKYKLVYYLAITTSLIFFLISAFSIFALFENFSILNLLFIGLSIIVNSFAFINLLEKYDKAVLFLNSGLVLNIIFSGYYVLLGFLSKGWDMITIYPHFKFFVLFIIILIIVNVFKMKENKGVNEIDNIGTHNE